MNPWTEIDALKIAHGKILARARHAARFLARRKYHSRLLEPVEIKVTGIRWTATLQPNARCFNQPVVLLTVASTSGEEFAAGLEALANEWKGFEPWTP